jgi:hypothetical protein
MLRSSEPEAIKLKISHARGSATVVVRSNDSSMLGDVEQSAAFKFAVAAPIERRRLMENASFSLLQQNRTCFVPVFLRNLHGGSEMCGCVSCGAA